MGKVRDQSASQARHGLLLVLAGTATFWVAALAVVRAVLH